MIQQQKQSIIKMSTKINLRSSQQKQQSQTKGTSKVFFGNNKKVSQQIQNPQQNNKANGKSRNNVKLPGSPKKQQFVLPLEQLMIRLSHYRDLKQLPLNPVSQQAQQLWRDSPCTVRCVNRHVSVDRTERFKIGSIYYRDNINQQKKIFTETQKPQLMLKNFRRQIDEAGYNKHKYAKKHQSNHLDKNKSNFRKTVPNFQNKFYQVPKKIQLKYDRNGTRSAYNGNYDVKQIMERVKSTKSNFTSGQRIDLGLPLNYYPGPGKYFPENEDQYFCNTFRTAATKRSKSLLNTFKQNQQGHHTIDLSNEKLRRQLA